MPNENVNHTAAGWPYLDAENYLMATPAYTNELATKLQNSEANVAAAENAAQEALTAAGRAEQAAAGVGFVMHTQTVTVTATNALYADSPITWPAGRFAGAPTVQATIANGAGDVRIVCRAWATSATAGVVRIGLPASGSTTVPVAILAIRPI